MPGTASPLGEFMSQPAPDRAQPSLCGLRRRAEFLRVAASGKRAAAPGLVLQVAPRPIETACIAAALGVGYTVTRKVGGSVVRNRARRRLRAAVRQIMQSHAKPGFDYVLIGRSGTIERPFPLLLGDLEQALRRLDHWTDTGAPA
jgi:ribonuclease P protein component